MIYLLDSVILIDHFNGIDAATQFIETHDADCAISVITRTEVLTGFDKHERPLAHSFLASFQTLPIDADLADLAALLRDERRWKLPDAFQAALAQHGSLIPVTRNTKVFSPSGQPEILVPYTIKPAMPVRKSCQQTRLTTRNTWLGLRRQSKKQKAPRIRLDQSSQTRPGTR